MWIIVLFHIPGILIDKPYSIAIHKASMTAATNASIDPPTPNLIPADAIVVVELGNELVMEDGLELVLLAEVTVEFLLALPVEADTLDELLPVEEAFDTVVEGDDESDAEPDDEADDDESVVEADALVVEEGLVLVEAAEVIVEDWATDETVLDELMANSGVKLTLLVLVSSTISRA